MESSLKEAWKHGYASIKEYREWLKKESPGETLYKSQEDDSELDESEEKTRAVLPSEWNPVSGSKGSDTGSIHQNHNGA